MSKFEKLVGKTVARIEGAAEGSEQIKFYLSDGSLMTMLHCQDCCETVDVEDVSGDIADIINTPILVAEERDSETPPEGSRRADDCDLWTFYTIRTIKGTVDIRWHGASNGYYSVDVSVNWGKHDD
jgi:hypothetical protein